MDNAFDVFHRIIFCLITVLDSILLSFRSLFTFLFVICLELIFIYGVYFFKKYGCAADIASFIKMTMFFFTILPCTFYYKLSTIYIYVCVYIYIYIYIWTLFRPLTSFIS